MSQKDKTNDLDWAKLERLRTMMDQLNTAIVCLFEKTAATCEGYLSQVKQNAKSCPDLRTFIQNRREYDIQVCKWTTTITRHNPPTAVSVQIGLCADFRPEIPAYLYLLKITTDNGIKKWERNYRLPLDLTRIETVLNKYLGVKKLTPNHVPTKENSHGCKSW